MSIGISDKGFSQIIDYFKDEKNHLDEDKYHISRDEFRSAVGKISDEADNYLVAVSQVRGNYERIRKLQSEGWFNDPQVSMRDMYAAKRGTGYDGESIDKTEISYIESAAFFLKLIGPDEPIRAFFRNTNKIDTGTSLSHADAMAKAALTVGGDDAIERFKQLKDYQTETSMTDINAMVKAILATRGEDAIERFKQLKDYLTGASGKYKVIVKGLLAIGGDDTVKRFEQLKDYHTGISETDTNAHAMVKAMLAACGNDAIERFVQLKDYPTGASGSGDKAMVKAILASGGDDIVKRFEQLNDYPLGVSGSGNKAMVKAMLALGDVEGLLKFALLGSIDAVTSRSNLSTAIKAMLTISKSAKDTAPSNIQLLSFLLYFGKNEQDDDYDAYRRRIRRNCGVDLITCLDNM